MTRHVFPARVLLAAMLGGPRRHISWLLWSSFSAVLLRGSSAGLGGDPEGTGLWNLEKDSEGLWWWGAFRGIGAAEGPEGWSGRRP